MKNTFVKYSGGANEKTIGKEACEMAKEIKRDEKNGNVSWLGLVHSCGIKTKTPEEFDAFAKKTIKNYTKLTEAVCTRRVAIFEDYIHRNLGIIFLRNPTVQIGFNHRNYKSLYKTESSQAALFDTDDDTIYITPAITPEIYFHESAHSEVTKAVRDEEFSEFVYKHPKKRSRKKIYNLYEKKDKLIKLNVVNECFATACENIFFGNDDEVSSYVSYINRQEKEEDFKKCQKMFRSVLKKYPFMEIVNITKDVFFEANQTYGDCVEILERKIKEHDDMIFDINQIHENREKYLENCRKDPVLSRFMYLF